MLLQWVVQHLVEDQLPHSSSLMMWDALEVKGESLTVLTVVLEYTTVLIAKMLELSALQELKVYNVDIVITKH